QRGTGTAPPVGRRLLHAVPLGGHQGELGGHEEPAADQQQHGHEESRRETHEPSSTGSSSPVSAVIRTRSATCRSSVRTSSTAWPPAGSSTVTRSSTVGKRPSRSTIRPATVS